MEKERAKEIMKDLKENHAEEIKVLANNKKLVWAFSMWFRKDCCSACKVIIVKDIARVGKPDLKKLCEPCTKAMEKRVLKWT